MKKQNVILCAAVYGALGLLLAGCAKNNTAVEEAYYFHGTETCVAKIGPKSTEVVYRKIQKGQPFQFFGDECINVEDYHVQYTRVKGLAYLIIEGTEADTDGQQHAARIALPIFAKENEATMREAQTYHKCTPNLCDECAFVYDGNAIIIGCTCTDAEPSPYSKCNHSIYYFSDPQGPGAK